MAGPVKVGDEIGDGRPAVFELVLEDHIPFVDPQSFGLTQVAGIKPADYFVTSGDAVQKARILEKDIWHLAGELRKQCYELIGSERKCSLSEARAKYRSGIRPSSPAKFAKYEAAVWKAAGQARRLHNALKIAKGADCFLETEWDNHMLLCIPKNPRK